MNNFVNAITMVCALIFLSGNAFGKGQEILIACVWFWQRTNTINDDMAECSPKAGMGCRGARGMFWLGLPNT